MYLLGKTGMGKSTTIENMVVSDIRAGNGIGLVDPHGDLAEKILDFIPSARANDVVYFNPSDSEWPIAFNILETVDAEHKHLVASGMMGVFKKLWPDVWSARMEYILNNTILALLDYPNATMLGINRMLSDKDFRKKVISKIKDPVVKLFWVEEFSKYHDRFATEAIAPIQNKVGQFLSASIIRNIVGQVKSTIDLRKIMDEGKILIINLAKGKIGEDNSKLLGGLIVTRLQIAAMERVDIPEEQRRDFYLYVDEFQNFATESFANILSEARKYRLNLIIAHQYIGQLIDEKSTKIRDAVFGNVGTIVTFRIGAQDAEFLVKEFEPDFTEQDLVNLTKYDVYCKLMIDGVSSAPFSATTLTPLPDSLRTHNAEKVIRVSRERYGIPKDVIEDKIARWTGMIMGEEELSDQPNVILVQPPKTRAPVQPVLQPLPRAVSERIEREKRDLESMPPLESVPMTQPKIMISPETPISLTEVLSRKPVPFQGRARQETEKTHQIVGTHESSAPPKPQSGTEHTRIGTLRSISAARPPLQATRAEMPRLQHDERVGAPPQHHTLRRGEVARFRTQRAKSIS